MFCEFKSSFIPCLFFILLIIIFINSSVFCEFVCIIPFIALHISHLEHPHHIIIVPLMWCLLPSQCHTTPLTWSKLSPLLEILQFPSAATITMVMIGLQASARHHIEEFSPQNSHHPDQVHHLTVPLPTQPPVSTTRLAAPRLSARTASCSALLRF